MGLGNRDEGRPSRRPSPLRVAIDYLRDTRTEVGILLACGGIVAAVGDRLVDWALAAAAPGLAAELTALDPWTHKLLFGLLPALALVVGLLAWTTAPVWRRGGG